jgi:hypothetical protein
MSKKLLLFPPKPIYQYVSFINIVEKMALMMTSLGGEVIQRASGERG